MHWLPTQCHSWGGAAAHPAPYVPVPLSVNYLYRDRVRVMVRVRRPDSSGNSLIRRKIHYARQKHRK